jgi:polyamine oxidase
VPGWEVDDGSRSLLGGVAGPVERVVVVGAGVSGLAVANALTHAGVSCVVLEGRDRIAGRLHTVEVAGHPVDLGGSWIHMPIGNPMTALAGQAGIQRVSGDPTEQLSAYDCGEGRWLSAAEWAASLTLQYDTFPQAQAALVNLLGPAASMADAISAFLSDAGLAEQDTRRAWQALHAVIEAEAADLARRQSLRWMWTEDEFEGSYFGDLPVGGYSKIATALATGVDVQLGVEVTDILWTNAGVEVRTASGAAELASHVVVTVPLGNLKRGEPHFIPDLPAEHRASIDRLGFGRFEKLVLAFDRPFWRAAGVRHLVLFPPDPHEPAIWVLDLDSFASEPILEALLFHTTAARTLHQTAQQNATWLLDLIGQALGQRCPDPVAIMSTAWTTDRYSRGAYTHITPEASPLDCDLLGHPVGGRVLFAGEHTQSSRLAYADGALTSGIREAKRLLAAPSVRLDIHQ